MNRKLLIITPFFGKTGSEIAINNLADSVRQIYDVTIFTPEQHPDLKAEISEDITLRYPNRAQGGKGSLLKKIAKKIGIKQKDSVSLLDQYVIHNDFEIIILNTFLSLSYFQSAKQKGKRVIIYVHETEQMLIHIGEIFLDLMIDEADLIICSSHQVMSYLKTLGRNKYIEVLYPSLDFSKFLVPVQRKKMVREYLGFENSTFIWGMSGEITLNKNPKMFIEAAVRIYENHKNARFLWIGATGRSAYEKLLHEKVKEMKLEKIIKFIDKQNSEYYQYINELDGFVLTSFSESFSLVGVEAACFDVPVVSFPCGGIMEAVPKGRRIITKEFSVAELVEQMSVIMRACNREFQVEDIQELVKNDKSNLSDKFQDILAKYSFN